jgi:hypothetical protein
MILLLKLLTRKWPTNKLLNGFYYDHKAAYIAAQAILINNPQRKKREGLPISEKKNYSAEHGTDANFDSFCRNSVCF